MSQSLKDLIYAESNFASDSLTAMTLIRTDFNIAPPQVGVAMTYPLPNQGRYKSLLFQERRCKPQPQIAPQM